ncbi:MAG: hypothetical protein DRO23_07940 [Thermoprotei archaeon]|nr:MAG: hypothetical protein DRO23_07940 [Thermoprotei archaeon]
MFKRVLLPLWVLHLWYCIESVIYNSLNILYRYHLLVLPVNSCFKRLTSTCHVIP